MSQRNISAEQKGLPNGPVIMAYTLERGQLQERILIGEEAALRAYLEGRSGGDVLYDAQLPMGTLLCLHETYQMKNWVDFAVSPLKEALSSVIRRKEREQRAWQFLMKKQNSHDPAAIYTACQCWYSYTRNRTALSAAKNAEVFEQQAMGLLGDFHLPFLKEVNSCTAEEVLAQVRKTDASAEAEVWYPGPDRNREWLVLRGGLFPAILYSLNHMQDWGFCLCRCVNCGKLFAASSKHYSLCSERCKKEKSRTNKREFDERARKNRYDVEYKNVSQRIRNRLNNLRRRTDLPEEELDLAEETFAEFRKDARLRKKQIQSETDCEAFLEWMAEQEQRFRLFCAG